MAIHPKSADEGPLQPIGGVKVTDLGSEHRLLRDGVEQLAHGALVCPDCTMPVSIDGPVPIGANLLCSYCEQVRPARNFLLRDVYDTAANEVNLIARIEL